MTFYTAGPRVTAMDSDAARGLDAVAFLAGTPVRARALDALADGPRSRAALREALDAPRTTLRRNLAALADRGWIEHDPVDDEYALTAAGERARAAFDAATDALAGAAGVGAFLRRFPADPPIEPADVDALSVAVATQDRPHAPVSPVRDRLAAADRVRGFVPVVNPVYVRAVVDHLDALDVELVLSPTAAATLEDDYADAHDQLRAASGVDRLSSDAVPEWAVALLDGDAYLGAYDDGMRPVAVLHAPADHRVADWARDRYAAVRDAATPL